MSTKFSYVTCQIERGGFSGERTFSVVLLDGRKYTSLAPVHYFRSEDFRPLSDVQSDAAERGYVAALPLKKLGKRSLVVEAPDGELLAVGADQVMAAE